MVVTDPDKKKSVGELYRKSWEAYSGGRGPQYAEDDVRHKQLPKIAASSQYLADRFHEVPAMAIPCIHGRVDRDGVTNLATAGLYGSILPAAWSFMLAARHRGLVTAWTTLHLKFEKETAELLGMPYERITQAALITLGFSTGGEFKAAESNPLAPHVPPDTW